MEVRPEMPEPGSIRSRTEGHEHVEPHRRHDQRHFDDDRHDDTEPDRIEAHARDDLEENGNRESFPLHVPWKSLIRFTPEGLIS